MLASAGKCFRPPVVGLIPRSTPYTMPAAFFPPIPHPRLRSGGASPGILGFPGVVPRRFPRARARGRLLSPTLLHIAVGQHRDRTRKTRGFPGDSHAIISCLQNEENRAKNALFSRRESFVPLRFIPSDRSAPHRTVRRSRSSSRRPSCHAFPRFAARPGLFALQPPVFPLCFGHLHVRSVRWPLQPPYRNSGRFLLQTSARIGTWARM
jgi:hypothetical protein